MKAEEMRIGNWIDYNGTPVLVDSGTIRNMHLMGEHHQYLPLELSPEILEKAGFVKIEGKDSIYDKGQMRLYLGIRGSLCYTEYEKGSYCYLRLIQYTHELQNLHYALYNSELPINL